MIHFPAVSAVSLFIAVCCDFSLFSSSLVSENMFVLVGCLIDAIGPAGGLCSCFSSRRCLYLQDFIYVKYCILIGYCFHYASIFAAVGRVKKGLANICLLSLLKFRLFGQ